MKKQTEFYVLGTTSTMPLLTARLIRRFFDCLLQFHALSRHGCTLEFKGNRESSGNDCQTRNELHSQSTYSLVIGDATGDSRDVRPDKCNSEKPRLICGIGEVPT